MMEQGGPLSSNATAAQAHAARASSTTDMSQALVFTDDPLTLPAELPPLSSIFSEAQIRSQALMDNLQQPTASSALADLRRNTDGLAEIARHTSPELRN
ncbi:hypothetical protein, partial [uncultured Tateyamaria sp.]|uniref:hypothetical protein n=1 Tax=uncultured Tateyamaria sp. TaxID=455651 RepID=UPI00262D2EC9